VNGYIQVCTLADLPGEGGMIRVDVAGEPVAIVATGQQEWFAISDVCSHEEVALSDGEVDGHTIECWRHGSRFDLRTGEALGPPATEAVPVYGIKVEGDHVYVSMAPSVLSTPNQELSR
jgi:3-phenylpropionate/trans-cinnamate dioxygenase ferredoxin subunit